MAPLLEPYLQMLVETLNGGHMLVSDEIEFLVKLSNLESVSAEAVQLCTIFTQLFFGSLFYARLVLKPILSLIDRNRRQQWVPVIVDQLTKQACQTMLALKKDEQAASLKRVEKPGRKAQAKKTKEEDTDRKIRRYFCISVLEELYALEALQISEGAKASAKTIQIPDFKKTILAEVKLASEQYRTLYM